MQYYKVTIHMTGKPMGRTQEDYSTFDVQTLELDSVEAVKQELKDRYGNCKRVNMYQDAEDGQPELVGYIYCFKNADYSHYPVQHWYQQDWVSVHLMNGKRVLVKH